MRFSRQEYWSGLLCPPPRNLPDHRIKPMSHMSPALAGRLFTTGQFFKRKCMMVSKHLKKCSISLVIREMQIKTIMRYHLTPVRMVIIKKSTNNKCWRRYGEKGIFLHCWWECKLVQPLWKTVWRFLKKLKTRVAIYLAMPLLGIYPDKTVTAPLCS